ncbi:hypothetical protein TURU_027303 [Turdus rufiventris]|nr:hypothetical protein TURU_027303 [Turdus rufiventris]
MGAMLLPLALLPCAFLLLRAAASLQVDIVPSQGEISVGESKFFLCQVAGEAKFKDISWFSPNGERLSPNQQRISVVRNDDFSSTLTIYNANIDDAGIYKCVVSSPEEGDSEATVNVKIFQKLMFRNAPTPQEFKEGDDAVIVCDVVSSLPPTIIWKHKGRDVILKKDVRFIVLSNNYLQIRGIKKTDEGTYRCEGRILARGEINFKDIQVIVNVPPSVRARQSTMNATANLSQSVTLACDADGFPEPTVTWTKDGEPLEEVVDEDKFSLSSDGSELQIRRVDKSDEAEYTCIAENKAGEADATIQLKVFAKPKITYVENKTAMELEDQITLTCEASGDPIPSITWRTSTRNISNEEKTLDGRIVVRSHARVSSLTLKDIQYTDAGEYVCTASNTIGQDSQPMYLEVQYAPKLQGPVAVYTWEGNQVNITCEVFAYPSAVISWFRDGQLLPSSNYSNIKIYNTPSASYLEVTPDSENDFGNYNCTAVNRIGQESSEFILVQADTPSSPSIGRVEPYSSSAQVEFDEPEATGGVPILRYKAEWRALGEGDWHTRLYDAKEANVEGMVTITGLRPETTYAVRLSAVNGKGVGELSLPAEFKTQPVREPSAPKLEGHIGEDGNSIKVNVIKQDDGGSPIRHYLIKYKASLLASSPFSHGWSPMELRVVAVCIPVAASTSPASGLGTAAIIGILVVVFVALLVAVDVTCYFLNKCGLLMCIAVNLCGKSGPGAKGKDMEEGKAAFSRQVAPVLDIPVLGILVTPGLDIPGLVTPVVDIPVLDILDIPVLDILDIPVLDILDIPVVDIPVLDSPVLFIPVLDIPVLDIPLLDIPVLHIPILVIPLISVLDIPVLDIPVLDIPALVIPVLDTPVLDISLISVLDTPVLNIPVLDTLVIPVLDIPVLDISLIPVLDISVLDTPVLDISVLDISLTSALAIPALGTPQSPVWQCWNQEKDESKEPIVEVRTEEERTPNHDGGKHTEPNETTPLTEPEHPADTAATVEDMLPSVTTGTTNSDTITETFATAQNSPTSESTTLTSSIAPPAAATADASAAAAGQATPAKGTATTSVSSPPPSSTPRVAPLVDLSDTPSSAPATNNLSSSVLPGQAVLSPSAAAADAAKAGSKPATPSPGSLTSPAAPSEPKQEVAKSPEKEPSTVKSPAETPKNPRNVKSEAASGSAANPSQNEDLKMDEGTFKPPDIDLAKDVFAALGTATPPAASGAGGQAPEAAAADSSAPAKTEKMPAEDKGAVQDRKSPPAEVKTVPNEATQTKENESKA